MSFEDPAAKAREIAIDFKYNSVQMMVERFNVPQQARILGVGATTAALGQEIAFYRSDIHWTNVADDYTNTGIAPGADGNIEHIEWDIAAIEDFADEKSFDHIYAHGNDLKELEPERLQTLGTALLRLLNDGGKIEIAVITKSFVEGADLNMKQEKLTYTKPKSSKAEKHLTTIPKSTFKKDETGEPLHFYAPTGTRYPILTTSEKVSAIAATLLEGGMNLASSIWNRFHHQQ